MPHTQRYSAVPLLYHAMPQHRTTPTGTPPHSATHSTHSVAYAQRASPQALPNAAAASAGQHVLQQTQLQQQYADPTLRATSAPRLRTQAD